MKEYECRVRLAGDIRNEVRKTHVTAPEIVLLKRIHGSTENGAEPVVNIKLIGSVKRTEGQERARLAQIYAQFQGKPGALVVSETLGVGGVPLPQWVEGVDEGVPEPTHPSPTVEEIAAAEAAEQAAKDAPVEEPAAKIKEVIPDEKPVRTKAKRAEAQAESAAA